MSAIFSPDRVYRYELRRTWRYSAGYIAFVGLNPSTADETANDPTIRRCMGFAKRWGYGGLVMVNLFAFRATDPRDMQRAVDPVGPQNDEHLRRIAAECDLVAAWGAGGRYRDRAREVRQLLGPCLWALGFTSAGEPRHPLYVRSDQPLQPVPR